MFKLSSDGKQDSASPKSEPSRKAEVITVASGKGGVGKTLFSINFAIEAAMLGKKTLLLDADLGLANVHIMTGIYPDHDIMDVVNNQKTIQEIIVEGPGGVHIIPGASGFFQLSNLSHQKRQALVNQLSQLEDEYDLIVIDTEAGISHNVMKFITVADKVIIVTTPDLTALSDAYAIIKIICTRYTHDHIGVVVNRVRSINEADAIYTKISMACEKFLNYKVTGFGSIFEDVLTVKESIQTRKPITLYHSKSKVGTTLKGVAYNILGMDQKKNAESKMILNRFSMLLENMRTKEPVTTVHQ